MGWAVWSIHVKPVLLLMGHRWPPPDQFVPVHPNSASFIMVLRNPVVMSLPVAAWCHTCIQADGIASLVSA